jgi:hypothetical protein
MSRTETLYPLAACLNASEVVLRNMDSWKGWKHINKEQANFISRIEGIESDLQKLSAELETQASFDHKVLTEFAEKRGFKVAIGPFENQEFGAISFLNVNLSWMVPGKNTVVKANGKAYKAFELKDVDVYRDGRVQVTAHNGDLVTFQMTSLFNTQPKENQQLSDTVRVILPEVCLEDRPDVSWLQGMFSGNYHIKNASQITRFMMDKNGASVKSMAHIDCTRSMSIEEPIVFDRPFKVTITRKGLKLPIFVGYINYDSWITAEELKIQEGKIPAHHTTNLLNWMTIDQSVVDEIKGLLETNLPLLKNFKGFRLRRSFDIDYVNSLYGRYTPSFLTKTIGAVFGSGQLPPLPSATPRVDDPKARFTMEVYHVTHVDQKHFSSRVGLIIFSMNGNLTLLI